MNALIITAAFVAGAMFGVLGMTLIIARWFGGPEENK